MKRAKPKLQKNESKGPAFQPIKYEGEVFLTTDDFVFLDFDVGFLKLPRNNKATKYAKGQRVFFQIAILSEADTPPIPA